MMDRGEDQAADRMDMCTDRGGYDLAAFFENWLDAFCLNEIFVHEDGTEDLKILEANQAFANLISMDYDMLIGRLFTDVCPMAAQWLPFYIQTAKEGGSSLHELYNQDLKRYLSTPVFSPKRGQVVVMVIERTHLWDADQALRARDKDLAALFSSMTAGFCMGRILRDEQGEPVDILFELVNASYEILEGFPTATLQGKRLSEVGERDQYFSKYVEVVNHKSKITFTKHVAWNDFTLEVICFSQFDDMFVSIENNISERIKSEKALLEAYATIEEQNKNILSSIDYASKIQKNLLPSDAVFQKAFLDYSILWSPRDVVGGDIYWLKNFEEGSILCVCDCTGHGTPGALLTMLVVSIFESTINAQNYMDTAQVMWLLDQSLARLLTNTAPEAGRQGDCLQFNDGCDLAVLFIAKDGSVRISSGNTYVFVCDGKAVQQIRGQRLQIGEGKLKNKENVKVVTIPANCDQKFYIASDGLYDQVGGKSELPFGYKTFKRLILAHHGESQAAISSAIWETFESYRGGLLRRDDVELISFKPYGNVE